MFKLEFETGNAAFDDDADANTNNNAREEIARILRDVAHRVRDGSDGGFIRDVSGNRIGTWDFEPYEEEEEEE